MKEIYDLLEYLLDRDVKTITNLISAVKKGIEKEEIVEHLRILQGDLMVLREICAWMKSKQVR